jgi:hypothetical protein
MCGAILHSKLMNMVLIYALSLAYVYLHISTTVY